MELVVSDIGSGVWPGPKEIGYQPGSSSSTTLLSLGCSPAIGPVDTIAGAGAELFMNDEDNFDSPFCWGRSGAAGIDLEIEVVPINSTTANSGIKLRLYPWNNSAYPDSYLNKGYATVAIPESLRVDVSNSNSFTFLGDVADNNTTPLFIAEDRCNAGEAGNEAARAAIDDVLKHIFKEFGSEYYFGLDALYDFGNDVAEVYSTGNEPDDIIEGTILGLDSENNYDAIKVFWDKEIVSNRYVNLSNAQYLEIVIPLQNSVDETLQEISLHNIAFGLRSNFVYRVMMPETGSFTPYSDPIDIIIPRISIPNTRLFSLDDSVILPSNQGDINTQFQFSTNYTHQNNIAPDSVNVVIDDVAFPLATQDEIYSDGAEFSTIISGFPEGTHSYYFSVELDEKTTRYPDLYNLTFATNDTTAGQISLIADQTSIPFDGTSVNLTATILDSSGAPLQGETVTFIQNHGALNPSSSTTDENGQVHVQYTPGTSGTATIQATTSNGLSDSVSVDVYQSTNAIETTLRIALVSQAADHSEYHIYGESTYTSNGNPVSNTDIIYEARDANGNLVGKIDGDDYGVFDNPVTDRMDEYGRSRVSYYAYSSGFITIKANVQGSINSTVAYVQVGPPPTTNISPFKTLNAGASILDLALAPDAQHLIVSTDSRAKVVDLSTYSFGNDLVDRRTFDADFSNNGDTLVIVSEPCTDCYSINVYNGNTLTHQRGILYGSQEKDVRNIAVSP
ncbi:MAG: hypothetical protein HN590_19255, partial [Calditrichaeota bacterium]|nr:hypothetical protein [Calditrichota bacterium]